MAAEDDYYPFSAEVDGQLVGLVPELTRAAFEAVDVDVAFTVSPFNRVLMQVQAGLIVGGFTGAIDESNESLFYWHKIPLGIVKLAIWAKKGTSRKGLTAEDMEQQTVAVTRGFFYTDAIDTNDEVVKAVAPSDESSLQMLALNRADFALVTEKIGYRIIRSSDAPRLANKLEIVGLIDEVPLHAFFSRKHPDGKEIAGLFQTGLEKIKANGTYQRIQQRWSQAH